jgi:hypothetical protein
MTVRKREERKRGENATRRPALVPILVKEGLLGDGQKLWVSKTVLRPADRSKYNPDDPAYQVEVRVEGGSVPKFAWRPSETAPIELLDPLRGPLPRMEGRHWLRWRVLLQPGCGKLYG